MKRERNESEKGFSWGFVTGSFVCMWFLTLILVPAISSASEKDLEREVRLLLEENKRLSKRLEVVERELKELKAEREKAPSETKEVRTEETAQQEEEALGLSSGLERLSISGLLEFGGAYRHTAMKNAPDHDESDLAMTTVELDVSSRINNWVSATGVFLYEDPTFENEETSFDVDSASIVMGNEEAFPVVLTLGKVYVPFGALLTHFPDDPFIPSPMTLLLGETNEKAVIGAYKREGYTLSAYAFNGDTRGRGGMGSIESYGFDIHFEYGIDLAGLNFYKRGEKFKHNPTSCIDFLMGASFISDLSESDGLEDAIGSTVTDPVGGIDFYLHAEHCGLFLDAEFMGAVERFSDKDLASGNTGARPYVWNFEAGFNYNWWKNLEVALKLAGSQDTEALGLPERRIGFNLNQELFEGVTFSLGYLHDEFHGDDVEDRSRTDTVYGQMAVEF